MFGQSVLFCLSVYNITRPPSYGWILMKFSGMSTMAQETDDSSLVVI